MHTHTHTQEHEKMITSYRTSSQVSIKKHCNKEKKPHSNNMNSQFTKEGKKKDNSHTTKVLALVEIDPRALSSLN